ncbi:30S ribosomal protein S9 [candidate division KSB1 bacterium]|jgi:small subunit ribosomal protein S9|nr:30S ribosomal protein S9 [candidate division KSB1 bacterium]
MKGTVYSATGRRKDAVARVRLAPGTGQFTINGRELLDHFKRDTLRMVIEQPFVVTDTLGSYDIVANVKGGGLTGQAGAVLLGVARALVQANDDFRSTLRRNGFLTRDPRMVERKKYGQPKARKRFQFSKR